jgi:hypothetical protein
MSDRALFAAEMRRLPAGDDLIDDGILAIRGPVESPVDGVEGSVSVALSGRH